LDEIPPPTPKVAAMRRFRRLLALPVVAVLTVGLVGPAIADSGWVPVPDGDDYTVAACHTTLTVREKVNQVQQRTTTLRDGTLRTDYRGTYVVSVSAPDRRKVVLDNSGAYSEFEYPDGDIFYDVDAPALIVYYDAVERAAFAKAGLPPVFYYTKGELKLYLSDGRERVVSRPRQVTSICDLLRR
jgi:hypothetical protein